MNIEVTEEEAKYLKQLLEFMVPKMKYKQHLSIWVSAEPGEIEALKKFYQKINIKEEEK